MCEAGRMSGRMFLYGVTDAVGCLILDLLDRHHIDRLGYIDQRRIRARRADAAADLVGAFGFPIIDRGVRDRYGPENLLLGYCE